LRLRQDRAGAAGLDTTMTDAGLLNIVIALSSVLVGVFGTWLTRPKVVAEAIKATAEAAHAKAETASLEWTRFHAEIARQDIKIAALEDKMLRQEAEIENLKHDRDDRDLALVASGKENKTLKAHVGRLEKRLAAIEDIFQRHVMTPEMRAELDGLTDK
jgi:septal ring factor EnvC (AmiA/AmiB activator)